MGTFLSPFPFGHSSTTYSRGIQDSHLRKERIHMAVVVTRNVGMLLLAVWLILTGLFSLFNISFAGEGVIMGILALASGILILMGR